MEKTCTKCGNTKCVTKFPINNGRPRGFCKECYNMEDQARRPHRSKGLQGPEYPREHRREHYRETIHRLERLGISSPEFTKAALERVENLEIT